MYTWEEVSAQSEADLLDSFVHQPHFFYLDSADSQASSSQFSVMGANPFLVMSTRQGQTTLVDAQGTRVTQENPFELLDSLLAVYRHHQVGKFPFLGGAVGYVGYEACQYAGYQAIPFLTGALPDLYFAFYHDVIVIDRYAEKKWKITGPSDLPNRMTHELRHASVPFKLLTSPQSCFTQEGYKEAIQKVKAQIYEGDFYQLNLSHRFEAKFRGNLWPLYQTLRAVSPAPYSAFLDTGEGHILSLSPEQFLQIDQDFIQTRPIKGTVKRGAAFGEDQAFQTYLLHSEKNKAELMMIVDLMRNDLGQICQLGTVEVSELMRLESYAQVHHLVSTIQGRLQTQSHVEAFKALFPGGSITGAPKGSAMKSICKFEPVPRSVYTGAIGYFGFNQQTQFNIAIRTLYTHLDSLYFHGGGGIVADSDPQAEWEETLVKIKAFYNTLIS